MRVLHIVPSVAPERGGPTQVVLGLARGQAARGATVRVLSGQLGDGRDGEEAARSLAQAGVALRRVRVVGPAQIELAPGLLGRWRGPAWGALGEELAGADVVHLHTVFTFPVALPAWLCRRRGVPHLVRPAGTLDADCLAQRSPRRKRLAIDAYVRDSLIAADAVHATSAKEAAELLELAPGARVVVLPPGASLPAVAVAPDGGGAGRAVGSLGRLHPAKQLEALIDAFALVVRPGDGRELLLAGAGERGYVARLAARAAARGVGERVRFLGQLDEAGKAALFERCEVLAFPSLHESFGLAVAEAMAAGRAVVVSPGVALAAEIAARGAGLVVPAEPAALAGAIGALLDDGADRARRAAAGRALASARYSWDAAVDGSLALYRRLLEVRAQGGGVAWSPRAEME